ncbi:MAG TPA: carbonate dehydratase [Desulfatiglandales bacterium]|nr:carbonate dehydratase [Desulfatiglandales bacterium]
MKSLSYIFENNRKWADQISRLDPAFFVRLAKGQSPEILWIGCSDSRVPPNEITGLLPGELFVHRNIANLVIHTDISCLSALQYGVDVLKVKHVIICGHYGCGGVKSWLEGHPHGLVDNWLSHIHEVYIKNERELTAISNHQKRLDRLCELNTIEQTANAGNTTIVQEAWKRGQALTIHCWMYGIADGLLKEIAASISSDDDLKQIMKR